MPLLQTMLIGSERITIFFDRSTLAADHSEVCKIMPARFLFCSVLFGIMKRLFNFDWN